MCSCDAIETRRATIDHHVAWLAERHGFPSLQAVGPILRSRGVEATREIDGKATTACRYYILPKLLSATRFLEIVRAHWHVGNRLHWVLRRPHRDVVMDEDQSRARKDNEPENLPDCAASRSTSFAPTRTKTPHGARSSTPLDDTFLLQLLATV
jgi:predicted transposase YbfD/YdcC